MITMAFKQDAMRCIELLNLAMEDIAFCLSGTRNRAQSDAILASFFTQDVNRISYKNVYVYKKDKYIAGVICAYFGGDLDRLDEPILKFLRATNPNANLDAECFKDEFYIDSIAVDEKFRGQGIASELINFILKLAQDKNLKKVALIVDENKIQTKEFYERFGFKTDCIKSVNSHKYYHMIKEL